MKWTWTMDMYDTSSESESNEEIPSETCDAAELDPIKEKTKKRYNKVYEDFMKWKISKNKDSIELLDEKLLLAYFEELSSKLKSSSLWTFYSMLKCTLSSKHAIDISKYCTVISFLKSKAKDSTIKKSKTFSTEEIDKFLKEANDYDYLALKVALIFGIVGGCQRQELYNLKFKDVEIYESIIIVKIYSTRSAHGTKTYRIFSITGSFYELSKKYIILRPDPCHISSFFLQYRSGKCMLLRYGINHFGKIGKVIAGVLGLPNPERYTGNCFKRTSRMLANVHGGIIPALTTLGQNHAYQTAALTEPRVSTNSAISNSQPSNQSLDSFDNQNFVYVEVNSPNTTAFEDSTNDSLESKSQVWNQIHNSTINNDVKDTNTHTGHHDNEDYTKHSKHQASKPLHCSLDNSDSSNMVNINIPPTSANSTLPEDLGSLLQFSNCKIENIKIYYSK